MNIFQKELVQVDRHKIELSVLGLSLVTPVFEEKLERLLIIHYALMYGTSTGLVVAYID